MVTPDPLVSVVVATNRGGRFLAEALASVGRQTWSGIEVVIVDDGVPDPQEVEEVARTLPGCRVVRITPSGVSVARNVGAQATSGEYLVFLDDDDRWHPDRVGEQLAMLQSNPEAVASYCGMEVIDAGGAVVVPADQWQVADRLDIARGQGGILLPNLMLRRAAFAEVGGFHSRIALAEDLDLTLRLAERGPFVFVDLPLVQYRSHSANTTKSTRELVGSIRRIVELHRSEARARGDAALVEALSERLRQNERYAWWRAARLARTALTHRRYAAAAGELWWVSTTQPRGLAGGLRSRLRRGLGRAERQR